MATICQYWGRKIFGLNPEFSPCTIYTCLWIWCKYFQYSSVTYGKPHQVKIFLFSLSGEMHYVLLLPSILPQNLYVNQFFSKFHGSARWQIIPSERIHLHYGLIFNDGRRPSKSLGLNLCTSRWCVSKKLLKEAFVNYFVNRLINDPPLIYRFGRASFSFRK